MSFSSRIPLVTPPLTSAEADVLLNKSTEPPFSGALAHEKRNGGYYCRQCGSPLFGSEHKFACGCGWPAFDECLPGAVRECPDADGRRVEIVCSACNGHLGHIFRDEGLTLKNTRYCVNSLSLIFMPEPEDMLQASTTESAVTDQKRGVESAYETACFAGGCFWGVESFFAAQPGVVKVESGYTGGTVVNPSYDEVCTGETGHAEAVRVVFDPARIAYETLARGFFEIHDPTQLNRQGPDYGTQYRSAVFYTTEGQRETAEYLLTLLREKGYDVVTEVEAAGVFYPAEEYHQQFFIKHPHRAACHRPVQRFR